MRQYVWNDLMSRVLATVLALGISFVTMSGFASPALANDGAAGIDATGLRLQENYVIEMAKEVLQISPSKIQISYDFKNTSEMDQKILVAFPLPPVESSMFTNYSVDPEDPVNFVDFTITVDGKPVTPKVETKFVINDVDFTNILTSYGITKSRFDPDFSKSLMTLSEDAKKHLASLGLISYDAGEGEIWPLWNQKTTFYWWQTFPAGKILHVEHSYRPIPFAQIHDLKYSLPDIAKDYCIEDSFFRALEKRLSHQEYPSLLTHSIRYILTTANTWKGPIGDFQLIIDKEKPTALVSLCINGIRKIAPTKFEFRAKNFKPEKELDILFVAPIN